MSVVVAEYLGVRVDKNTIQPHKISKSRGGEKPLLPCPFKKSHCDKAKRGDKPVCSVRDVRSGDLWIVCSHRLCATSPKESELTDHQANVLYAVAKKIFGEDVPKNDVLVKREVPIKVTEDSNYSADFVMWRKNPRLDSPFNPDRAVVLEMQGGGETTNTGILTAQIDKWDTDGISDNALLVQPVSTVAPLVTNAWRRQQEQFLVKGNVAMMTGARMVFCVGSMIYDYLLLRFRDGILVDLKDANWTLAIIAFEEDREAVTPSSLSAPNSIPLKISEEKVIYTNYSSFVQVLTNQALPSIETFTGEYHDLFGSRFKV